MNKEIENIQRDVVGEALCLDNAGLEEDFEVGIVYPFLDFVEDDYEDDDPVVDFVEQEEKLICVENRYGEQKQVLRERFELKVDRQKVSEIRKKKNKYKEREIEADRKKAIEKAKQNKKLADKLADKVGEAAERAKEAERMKEIKRLAGEVDRWKPDEPELWKYVYDDAIMDFKPDKYDEERVKDYTKIIKKKISKNKDKKEEKKRDYFSYLGFDDPQF